MEVPKNGVSVSHLHEDREAATNPQPGWPLEVDQGKVPSWFIMHPLGQAGQSGDCMNSTRPPTWALVWPNHGLNFLLFSCSNSASLSSLIIESLIVMTTWARGPYPMQRSTCLVPFQRGDGGVALKETIYCITRSTEHLLCPSSLDLSCLGPLSLRRCLLNSPIYIYI